VVQNLSTIGQYSDNLLNVMLLDVTLLVICCCSYCCKILYQNWLIVRTVLSLRLF